MKSLFEVKKVVKFTCPYSEKFVLSIALGCRVHICWLSWLSLRSILLLAIVSNLLNLSERLTVAQPYVLFEYLAVRELAIIFSTDPKFHALLFHIYYFFASRRVRIWSCLKNLECVQPPTRGTRPAAAAAAAAAAAVFFLTICHLLTV